MTDHETNPDKIVLPPKRLRQSQRDRWSNTVAAAITAAHFLAGLYVIGWYYFIVPRSKFEFEAMAPLLNGVKLSPSPLAVIMQSDVIVNYWYLLFLAGLPVLIADFLMMRWMAKPLGLSATLLCGLGITLLILLNYFYGNYVLTQELSRLRVLTNSSGQTISP